MQKALCPPKCDGYRGEKPLCDWFVYRTSHFFHGIPFLLERTASKLRLLKPEHLADSFLKLSKMNLLLQGRPLMVFVFSDEI